MSKQSTKKPQTKAEAEAKEIEAEETVEETKVEEVKESEAEAVEEKAEEPKMYVGPTIPGVGIQNTVYTEIPEGAAALMKELPEFCNLFIAIQEYPKACRMLREGNGYIFSAFSKALAHKNKK